MDKDYKIEVLYSNDIFSTQFVGGISRYIYELYKRNTNAKIPLIYSENLYLNKFKKKLYFKGKTRLILLLNNALEKLYLKKPLLIYHLSYYKNVSKPKNASIMVVTVHDMIHEIYADSYFKNDKITTKLKLLNCKEADGIITVSNQTKKDLIKIFNIKENKIKVIYLGHSLQKYEAKLPFEKGYILFVGSRGGYKNFRNFVKAISILKTRINVICVGNDFNDDEISLLNSLKLKDRFKTYYAKDNELYSLYNNAKCFVFPSFYEGFGIPILEAFFSSCVCVLSNIEVFREIASDAALYFDPNLPQDIAYSINKILKEDTISKNLIKKANKRLEYFSWENTYKQTMEFYKYLLDKKENILKKALIIGANGQYGYFLMKLLASKGYEVHIMVRHQPIYEEFNFIHYDDLYFSDKQNKIIYHYGDITDSSSILDVLSKAKPYEIYNLFGISNVKISFSLPQNTADSIALGTIRILESIKSMNLKCKFYNACSSEIYGDTSGVLNEDSAFNPKSPYAIAKLYAFYMVRHYREAYNIFAVSGILFNHESHLRKESFVSKKIIKAAVLISHNKQDILYLGNLDSTRDFGYAKDYVECMYLMMQHNSPKDYCISTGKQHSIREFCEIAFSKVGINLIWRGSGINEVGINKNTNKTIIKINPNYFCPLDILNSKGDSSKAQNDLGWNPNNTDFNKLIEIMLENELKTYNKLNNAYRGGVESKKLSNYKLSNYNPTLSQRFAA
ncbi:GDP-mannose 4,6-dehydratase [Helicobacter sp. MIT 14-3879]|uniref:GDP-mannose 4,6-dehydratase n=1 Tax=Helicobacter sp. MIT 14-3879 TaxID=2040649 RepID=UPI000E1EC293|nr:GDP-mannose 4,6-dehydratase [Helicobacter sp. MIT 14-3879]RDU63994.1 hypothetical protein CQA44_04965 [Helicobacter sp. MIT 14-3879]